MANIPTLFLDLTQLASSAVELNPRAPDFLVPGTDIPLANAPGSVSNYDQPVRRVIDPEGKVTGPLYPEVSINEEPIDQLVVTQHPVEQGATISDHAYLLPPEIHMRLGWSNSFGGYSGYVQQVYTQLRNIQYQRILFSLWTGKRIYDNMLIQDIRVHTDHRTEYTLLADVSFKQVLLASTQPIAGGAVSSAKPAAVADPTKNTPTQTDGQSYPVPATYPGSPFGSAQVTATGAPTGSPAPQPPVESPEFPPQPSPT